MDNNFKTNSPQLTTARTYLSNTRYHLSIIIEEVKQEVDKYKHTRDKPDGDDEEYGAAEIRYDDL